PTGHVAVTTWGAPALTELATNEKPTQRGPHEGMNIFVEPKANSRTFATYGYTDTVELWSSETMSRTHVFRTGQESITQLSFLDASDDVVTAGHDGRLVRWTPEGRSTLLARFDQAIERFAFGPTTNEIVVATVDGSIWRTTEGGAPVRVSAGDTRVNRLLA